MKVKQRISNYRKRPAKVKNLFVVKIKNISELKFYKLNSNTGLVRICRNRLEFEPFGNYFPTPKFLSIKFLTNTKPKAPIFSSTKIRLIDFSDLINRHQG